MDHYLHDAVSLAYHTINKTFSGNGFVPNRSNMSEAIKNTTFPGFYGDIHIGTNNRKTSYFILWDYHPTHFKFVPVLQTLVPGNDVVKFVNNIDWPHNKDLPSDSCLFDAASCNTGEMYQEKIKK